MRVFFMLCHYFDCRDIIVSHLSLSRLLDSENRLSTWYWSGQTLFLCGHEIERLDTKVRNTGEGMAGRVRIWMPLKELHPSVGMCVLIHLPVLCSKPLWNSVACMELLLLLGRHVKWHDDAENWTWNEVKCLVYRQEMYLKTNIYIYKR